MLTWSMKAPRKSSTSIITITTVSGVSFSALICCRSPSVAPEFASAWLNTSEPAMMNRIMVLILAVSRSALPIARHVKSAPSMPVIVIVLLNSRKK